MKERICLLLLVVVLAGCSRSSTPVTLPPPGFATAKMKPDSRLRGRIKSVNQQGQYVIIDFGLGTIPPMQTKMNVYRGSEVVGVLNLTGPSRQSIVAGDILSGEALAGDIAIWDQVKEEESDPEE
jgi:hypothetical protein